MMIVTMNNFVFLGVDPGSRNLGYSVVRYLNGQTSLLLSGIIKFDESDTLQKKLLYIFDYFNKKIKHLFIEGYDIFIAIEKQYYQKNFHSSSVLISINSIFLLISGQFNLKLFSIAKSLVKKIVSGYGGAEKAAISSFLIDSFSLNFDFYSYDEADAIAVAIAGLYLYLNEHPRSHCI